MKVIPEDRILIESDQKNTLHMQDDLLRICQVVSKSRGWNIKQTANITSRNAKQFFGLLTKVLWLYDIEEEEEEKKETIAIH